jgi:uncharacterized delta-60 repeat protein
MPLRCSWRIGAMGITAVAGALLTLGAPAVDSLSRSFGTGRALAERRSSSRDLAYALAIQRDGKVVAAGRSARPWRFALARYTGGGELDPSFGRGGKVLTDVGSAGRSAVSALAIQRDGRLVAGGWSDLSALYEIVVIGRYTTRGSLDPSFGRGGKVLTDFNSGKRASTWARALAIQTDGRFVVAGGRHIVDCGVDCSWRFALARYTPRGKLDPSFGRGGKVLTRLGSEGDEASAVAIQPDGKIVAAGRSEDYFALARYTANGRLDPSFGRGGRVRTGFGSPGEANGVAIQEDGKLVAAGRAGFYDFALARYTAEGSLDAAFGSGGMVVTNLGVREGSKSHERAYAVVIEADGKIVVAGSSDARGEVGRSGDIKDFALVRYNPDGSLDRSFGSGGKVLTPFVGNAEAQAVAIQRDGSIVAAGGGAGYFALARYTARGTLDPTFGTGGKVMTRFRSG